MASHTREGHGVAACGGAFGRMATDHGEVTKRRNRGGPAKGWRPGLGFPRCQVLGRSSKESGNAADT